MQKLFHFDSARENYVSDAAVVWCFDNRFTLVLDKFLKRIGVTNCDRIRLAGGAKCLASPGDQMERDFVLKQIRISMALHQTRRVVLTLHSDCGAYGGLDGAFGGDARLEAERQAHELQRAAATLRGIFPELAIEAYFIDFEGVWAVELE